MSINQIDSKLLLPFFTLVEGIKLNVYADSAGKPTIGIGSRYYANGTPVTFNDKPITKDYVIELFLNTIIAYKDTVLKYVTVLLKDCQLISCISFCYNEGRTAFKDSTLLKVINNNPNDFENIKIELKKWIYETNPKTGIKEKSEGLINRRAAEYSMYIGSMQIG